MVSKLLSISPQLIHPSTHTDIVLIEAFISSSERERLSVSCENNFTSKNKVAGADQGGVPLQSRMTPSGDMNKREIIELEGEAYKCKSCKTRLALANDIVTRYCCRRFIPAGDGHTFFNNVVNINIGAREKRMMISGMHTVADILCCCCGQILGWKYEAVDHETQKYKVGKFVLERVSTTDGVDSELNANAHSTTSETKDA